MSVDILIVDDEADIRALIKGILEDEGYSTAACGTSEKAYQLIESESPSLIILDIWLQGSADDGLAILKRTKAAHPFIPILMISGHGTIETAVSAIKDGAYDFIEKPFKADRLLLMIRRALETSALKRENAALKLQSSANFIGQIIGKSSAIEKLRQTVAKVAPTNSRVLLTGEAGTGKNVVARLIHENSDRSAMPYMLVNCATLNSERLEAELFGNVKDKESAPGLFEQANGGTLVLDEIADMSLETQSKIVRVLLERRLSKGSNGGAVDLDVRILATTNKNLPEVIKAGGFREDLYYRLNVVPMSLPPLRERPGDVSELVEEFIKMLAPAFGIDSEIAFDSTAMQKLKSYSWPGNVRQLRNVVEWMLIMHGVNGGQPYSSAQLPSEILGTMTSVKQDDRNTQTVGEDYLLMPLRDAREAFEREYLLAQIERFEGNISRTAQFVGMERSALHRKLKTLKVNEAAPSREEGVQASELKKRA